MPWSEMNALALRELFAKEAVLGREPMSELCSRFGISRKTGYKWKKRFIQLGLSGLVDLSTAPKNHPNRVPQHIEDLLVEARKRHPRWGPKKIIPWLEQRGEVGPWPANSTVTEIFRRNGLILPKRKRKKHKHPGAPGIVTLAPNDLWTIDYKGHFKLKNGEYCYPLTIVDQHSRFILACVAFPKITGHSARKVLRELFKKFGVPKAIRSDNGSPFSTGAIHGLSKLNAWWMRYGIQHQRINPGSPQENGAHERMHRTLKEACCLRPAKTLEAQQEAFDAFLEIFNNERPHEALDFQTPSKVYANSDKVFPKRKPKPDYAPHWIIKKITNSGTFRLGRKVHFLSTALVGEKVALEEISYKLWRIHYYDFIVGYLDEKTEEITQ